MPKEQSRPQPGEGAAPTGRGHASPQSPNTLPRVSPLHQHSPPPPLSRICTICFPRKDWNGILPPAATQTLLIITIFWGGGEGVCPPCDKFWLGDTGESSHPPQDGPRARDFS